MQSRIIGIDPGPANTAFAVLENGIAVEKGLVENKYFFDYAPVCLHKCFLEKMQSFGMPVGAEVFDTAYWIGEVRYRMGIYNIPVTLVTRQEVKLHHCNSVRAKDANIRQVMLDRFGGKEVTKKGGVLHGFKADIWSALAIACYGYDKLKREVVK